MLLKYKEVVLQFATEELIVSFQKTTKVGFKKITVVYFVIRYLVFGQLV